MPEDAVSGLEDAPAAAGASPKERRFAKLHRRMVAEQLKAYGVTDAAVLRAMAKVPREEFVPETVRELAYEDTPLPIGEGQTISQPYMVAAMTEALELEGAERVLEIGTGSGYSAAVLAEIADQVYTVERWPSLADEARRTLCRLGYTNVVVVTGDGTKGLAEHAPFDAIVVTAGGPGVPAALSDQLTMGGRLVIPVGKDNTSQVLLRVRRTAEHYFEEEGLLPVRFVPLIGEEGWHETVGQHHRDPAITDQV